MNCYLACFDISDDDARTSVSRRLEQYGKRVQRSVFEISVRHDSELQELKSELALLVQEDPAADIRFYRLCAACRSDSYDLHDRRVASYPAAIII